MSKRRIALVTPILPVPHDPTRGRYIHETARSLSRLADVRVYFPQPDYPPLPGLAPRSFLKGKVDASYTLDGIELEAFNYPALPAVSRLSNGYVAAHALTRRMRRFQPDVVLGYWLYPDGFAAQRAARNLGVPCVLGARGSDIHVRDGLNAFMTRRTIAQTKTLLTVSEAMRRTAIERYAANADRVHTIINGFDTQIFHPRDRSAMRTKLHIAQDARLIIYVGRLVETKGMRELIDAFAELASEDSKLQLALVGDGVMRSEIVRLLDSRNLNPRVLMPGAFGPDRVAEWISAADVLTLPSWSEGYPNVAVEAIACGRPVVATDVGGTREIVNANNGILIPARDTQALTCALREALDRSWDSASMAAAMQRSWDDVATDTLAVCEQAIVMHHLNGASS
jgi:teichuronic acid biosynthesis glycosyltransferase TuaC